MSENEIEKQRWWHAYGIVVPDGEPLAGEWWMGIAELSDVSPGETVRSVTVGPYNAPYLASWDHAPSQTDKNFVTPPHLRRQKKAPTEVPVVD